MNYVIDAKEASITSSWPNGRQLTMDGHRQYRADQTAVVFLVNSKTQPEDLSDFKTNTIGR